MCCVPTHDGSHETIEERWRSDRAKEEIMLGFLFRETVRLQWNKNALFPFLVIMSEIINEIKIKCFWLF
jgi:hypothetical protein